MQKYSIRGSLWKNKTKTLEKMEEYTKLPSQTQQAPIPKDTLHMSVLCKGQGLAGYARKNWLVLAFTHRFNFNV
jgi:hypothetical protein